MSSLLSFEPGYWAPFFFSYPYSYNYVYYNYADRSSYIRAELANGMHG